MSSTIIKAKHLPVGAQYYGHGFQFNRLSFIEILGMVRDYLRLKVVTPEESDILKRVEDTLEMVSDSVGDFVYLDADEFELLGITYYMRYLEDIKRKLAMGVRMGYRAGKAT